MADIQPRSGSTEDPDHDPTGDTGQNAIEPAAHARAERLQRALSDQAAEPRIAAAAARLSNRELARRAEKAATVGLGHQKWMEDLSGLGRIPVLDGLSAVLEQTRSNLLSGIMPSTWVRDVMGDNGTVSSWVADSFTRSAVAPLESMNWGAMVGPAINESLGSAMSGLVSAQFGLLRGMQDALSGSWPRFERLLTSAFDFSGLIRKAQTAALPKNLRDIALDADQVETVADEGLTIWSVPRRKLVERLLAAPDKAARRRILGSKWEAILEDCEEVAAQTTTGPHGSQAQFLAQAIAALRAGHTAAGQALAGNVLDSLLWMTFPTSERRDLTGHGKPLDHFGELDLGQAMVFRPVFRAYRPQSTPPDRAGDSTFARHGTAHNLTPKQVSRPNAVQAVMLAAALLNYLTFWQEV